MKIIRVFPSKTSHTPMDENVRFGPPGLFDWADEVHISITFTWDLKYGHWLAKQWERIAPVKIGGPATGMAGSNFTPGLYLKKGVVITSRGCNNKCWFCSVWKREGNIRELPITEGYKVADDNLLACSDLHIMNVFEMLGKQKNKAEFSGGLEARLLKNWHVDQLKKLNPRSMYFAYDTPDDLDPLFYAGEMLANAGFSISSHRLYCYVLVGYPKDTFHDAEKRCRQTIEAGFIPYAMLFRNHDGIINPNWKRFQREWSNFTITGHKIRMIKSLEQKGILS